MAQLAAIVGRQVEIVAAAMRDASARRRRVL
jgi:hypothetical protein